MAEKELAEANAATRSSFIASASHEIRTPLHHLQGYTDLLARSAALKDADRQLVDAIQSATRTLSLSMFIAVRLGFLMLIVFQSRTMFWIGLNWKAIWTPSVIRFHWT